MEGVKPEMRMSKKKLLHSLQSPASPSHETFILNYLRKLRRIRIIQLFIIIIFLASWEITTRLGILDSFIFSSPSRVIKTFLKMASDGSIFYHIGVTLLETFVKLCFCKSIWYPYCCFIMVER